MIHVNTNQMNSLEGLLEAQGKEDGKPSIKITDNANRSDGNIRAESSMKVIVQENMNAPAMLNSNTASPQLLKEKVIDNEKTEDIQQREILENATDDDKLSSI